MNRFFKIMPDKYEAIRDTMDAESGYPNDYAETWFAPASDAVRDPDGCCLIAAIAPIADRFAAAGAEELSAEQFTALIPQPDPEEI